jgi:UTP--glucose-1-phosphate uridylyltransferase
MKITKAVITAAGPQQRALPLQTLVDRDGVQKSALRILIEEATSAGVGELCVVTHPGDDAVYARAAGDHAARLTFLPQSAPRGYGHAVFCAREFVGRDPFLHLVGDHLYISRKTAASGVVRCARQLVEVAESHDCAVSAVQATRETMLPYFGAVGGKRVRGEAGLYQVERVQEKPTPTEAEQTLVVPGLRAGHYLCFFGMHVLTPAVMDILAVHVQQAGGADRVHLSGALAELAAREKYLAFAVEGRRYDMGARYGVLTAELALALSGRDREAVLAQLVELLAN